MVKTKGTYSVKEVAEYLGIGMNAAYELVHQPDFPVLKIGERRIVIPIEAFNDWIKLNTGKQN